MREENIQIYNKNNLYHMKANKKKKKKGLDQVVSFYLLHEKLAIYH